MQRGNMNYITTQVGWLTQKDCLQEIDSMKYNIHSAFTAHVPIRRDPPHNMLSSDIFSKYTLVNVCPGEPGCI